MKRGKRSSIISDSSLTFEGERGSRHDPLPNYEFDDFDVNACIPVPEYRGSISWIFPKITKITESYDNDN